MFYICLQPMECAKYNTPAYWKTFYSFYYERQLFYFCVIYVNISSLVWFIAVVIKMYGPTTASQMLHDEAKMTSSARLFLYYYFERVIDSWSRNKCSKNITPTLTFLSKDVWPLSETYCVLPVQPHRPLSYFFTLVGIMVGGPPISLLVPQSANGPPKQIKSTFPHWTNSLFLPYYS